MNYSFEAIEKQAQETHGKAASLLQNKDSFWKHKKTFGVVALSAALIGFSVFAPQTSFFKAALVDSGMTPASDTVTSTGTGSAFNAPSSQTATSPLLANNTNTSSDNTSTTIETMTASNDAIPTNTTSQDNTQTDATAVSVTPLSTSESSPLSATTDPEVLKKALAGQAQTITETGATDATQTINPFDSVLKARETLQNTNSGSSSSIASNQVPEVSGTEALHGAAPQIEDAQDTATDVTLPSLDNTSSQSLPFKENIHTTDITTDTQALDSTVSQDTETLHGATNIVPAKDDDSIVGTHRYTGTILNRPAKKGFAFSYYLELEDGNRLTFNTQRDLRNIAGKQVTIEVEGTRESFIFTHLYFNAKAQKHLPQSGPEMLVLFSGLIAAVGGWMIRKKQTN